MRLSRLLKLSFVGTLIFTPAMAQEADKVHEEALKVLRGADTSRANAAPVATAPSGQETRAQREERLQAEARRRLAERDRVQAERRRQFEEYVRERERLRQQQTGTGDSVHDKALDVLRQTEAAPPTTTPPPVAADAVSQPTAPVVSSTPQPAPAPAAVAPATSAAPAPTAQPSTEEIQQRALEILRQQNAQPAAAAPVRETELAPRVLATPAPAQPSTAVPAQNNEDIHQKALEVLRQQQSQSPVSTPAITPVAPRTTAPPAQDNLKPSPELQRRLDEMQRELQQEQRRSSAPPVDEAYAKELEQRALEMMKERAPAASTAAAVPAPASTTQPSATPAPRVDSQTAEMIRRQNQQISSATAAPVSEPARTGLDAAAEARAREILRQQQAAAAASSAAQPAYQSPAPAIAAMPSGAPSDVQYSRELEERARQMLLERQGQQAAAAPASSAIPASTPGELSTAPVPANPELNQIHRQAMQTLVQVEPGEGGQARLKGKRERLRALTDLYMADKLSPTEYHQKRAQILAEPNE